jgi:Fur family ferric uptake transcriptional regulator
MPDYLMRLGLVNGKSRIGPIRGIVGAMTETSAIVTVLDRAGYRLTEPRRVVAGLIADRTGHFTAADLVDDARQRRLDVGRATIFRALELFTELNAVERVDLPSGDRAYVECEPVHHHHVICSQCARTTEVGACGMPAIARDVGRRTGFKIQSHRLELFGICPDCQAANSRHG